MTHRHAIGLVLLAVACGAPEAPSPSNLPIDVRATRVSMMLRGVPPDPDEIELLRRQPHALADLTDAWIADPRFGETVRDLHADVLGLRADGEVVWPSVGAAEDLDPLVISHAMQEGPLHLVEHIVRHEPYTALVTADYTLTDTTLSVLEGLAHDPDGPEWQVAHYPDGRPHAGLLSASTLWQRWWTNVSGQHRNRANFLTRAFLCDEIGAIDMPVFPEADTSDPGELADALTTDPSCTVCHDTLDPLAAYFWGFPYLLTPFDIEGAYDEGCPDPDLCYPLRFYNVTRAQRGAQASLFPPAYYGAEAQGLAGLGQQIADDPRFASCAVENAWVFFSQQGADALPDDLKTELTDSFVASGHDYEAMVKQLVLDPVFARTDGPVLQVRPEALSRRVEHATGYVWAEDTPKGEVALLHHASQGLRDVAGGVDHDRVHQGNLLPSPTVLLAWDGLARRAAEHAVTAAEHLDPTLDAPDAVQAQAVALAARVTGRHLTADSPLVVELVALHGEARAAGRSPSEAWALVLRALLLDPTTVTY